MAATYLHDFTFRSKGEELDFQRAERRTCFEFFYPLNMFPMKGLRRVEFEPVTIFYGGNGSGKSTVLNIIAARLKVLKEIPFRPGQFFDWYVNGIDRDVTEHDGSVTHIHVDPVSFNSDLSEEWKGIPAESRILNKRRCLRQDIDRQGQKPRDRPATRHGGAEVVGLQRREEAYEHDLVA